MQISKLKERTNTVRRTPHTDVVITDFVGQINSNVVAAATASSNRGVLGASVDVAIHLYDDSNGSTLRFHIGGTRAHLAANLNALERAFQNAAVRVNDIILRHGYAKEVQS